MDRQIFVARESELQKQPVHLEKALAGKGQVYSIALVLQSKLLIRASTAGNLS
jgi:hypothetical protein